MIDTEIITTDDPRAAEYATGIKGWVSRHGTYHGDGAGAENAARYHGATHRICKRCEQPHKKESYCTACHEKDEKERFKKMPRKKWDGEAYIYSDALERYYAHFDDVKNDAEDRGLSLGDMELIVCEPNYAQIDEDYFSDIIADDYFPSELQDAILEFNEKMKGTVISWSPGKYALDLTEDK